MTFTLVTVAGSNKLDCHSFRIQILVAKCFIEKIKFYTNLAKITSKIEATHLERR